MNVCKNMAWRILSRRWHLIWPRWSLHWSGLGQFACYSAPTLIRQNPICAFYARLMDPENISLVPDNPTTRQYCGKNNFEQYFRIQSLQTNNLDNPLDLGTRLDAITIESRPRFKVLMKTLLPINRNIARIANAVTITLYSKVTM